MPASASSASPSAATGARRTEKPRGGGYEAISLGLGSPSRGGAEGKGDDDDDDDDEEGDDLLGSSSSGTGTGSGTGRGRRYSRALALTSARRGTGGKWTRRALLLLALGWVGGASWVGGVAWDRARGMERVRVRKGYVTVFLLTSTSALCGMGKRCCGSAAYATVVGLPPQDV